MNIETIPQIYLGFIQDAEPLNNALLKRFWVLCDQEQTHRSHFFHGRFENLYIDRQSFPEILPLLDAVEQAASNILGIAGGLKSGYWFNLMQPGQQTSLHAHDESDELLSGVYYVTVPERSGDLVLGTPPLATRLRPVAGMLALFPPSLPHAVERNESGSYRLSIAFNFGPAG